MVELSGFSRERFRLISGPTDGTRTLGFRQDGGFASPSYTFHLEPGLPSPGTGLLASSPHRPWGLFRNINRICHRPRLSPYP